MRDSIRSFGHLLQIYELQKVFTSFTFLKESTKWNGVESRALQYKPSRLSWQDEKCPDTGKSPKSAFSGIVFAYTTTWASKPQDFTTLVYRVVRKIPPTKTGTEIVK